MVTFGHNGGNPFLAWAEFPYLDVIMALNVLATECVLLIRRWNSVPTFATESLYCISNLLCSSFACIHPAKVATTVVAATRTKITAARM